VKRENTGLEFECPVCKKAFHATIRLKTGQWICFHCGHAGNFPKLVALLEGSTVKQAIRRISAGEISAGTQGQIEQISGFWDEEAEETEPEMVVASLPAEYAPVTFHPYLCGRQVSTDETLRHHIGTCETGTYRGRIIVPIIEYGEVVGFVARDYTGSPTQGKKILNPPISISRMVWNLDTCFDYNRVIICEGVFSALRVGYDAIATFGKSINSEQMRKIRQAGVTEAVLMWDSDVRLGEQWMAFKRQNGKKQIAENPAFRKMRMLADQFSLRIVSLVVGDPGDYPREVLRDMIERAPLFGNNIETI
jgi:phage/plasmid primase-like uncharacterized protein